MVNTAYQNGVALHKAALNKAKDNTLNIILEVLAQKEHNFGDKDDGMVYIEEGTEKEQDHGRKSEGGQILDVHDLTDKALAKHYVNGDQLEAVIKELTTSYTDYMKVCKDDYAARAVIRNLLDAGTCYIW